MATQIDNHSIESFSQAVHQEFSSRGGLLMDKVNMRRDNAKVFTFPVIGIADTHVHIPGSDITRSEPTRSQVQMTVENYVTQVPIDSFEEMQTNVDVKRDIVERVAQALRNRMDQIIIDALVAATITKTVAATFPSVSADNLNLAQVKEARRLLRADDVNGPLYLAAHVDGIHHFLDDTTLTSIDYNREKPLVEGTIGYYYGMNFIEVPDMTVGGVVAGLPVTGGGLRTNFAWSPSAIGAGMSKDFEIRVDYDPRLGGDVVTGKFSAVAGVIDPKGTVEISTQE